MRKKRRITNVPFRRRREGKTNYRKRLTLLKSGKPRAVVRKTLGKTIVQIVEYRPGGDRIRATAVSSELGKHGWKHSFSNTPASYLTGLLAGKRAIKKGISEAILDIGLRVPVKGSKVFAALKGLVDAGMDIPHGENIIPSEDVIKGVIIGENVATDFGRTQADIIKRG